MSVGCLWCFCAAPEQMKASGPAGLRIDWQNTVFVAYGFQTHICARVCRASLSSAPWMSLTFEATRSYSQKSSATETDEFSHYLFSSSALTQTINQENHLWFQSVCLNNSGLEFDLYLNLSMPCKLLCKQRDECDKLDVDMFIFTSVLDYKVCLNDIFMVQMQPSCRLCINHSV